MTAHNQRSYDFLRTKFFPFTLAPQHSLPYFFLKTHPLSHCTHFFFNSSLKKSTSGFSFCFFHAISRLTNTTTEIMKMWLTKDSNDSTSRQKVNKVSKKQKDRYFEQFGKGSRRVQCLLKQGTDTTHEIQLQIKGCFEDDPEWSEIIKARIQKRKKKTTNQTKTKPTWWTVILNKAED